MGAEDPNVKDFKLRPLKCECNFLSKSDGSAILSQGETVALVSVNGPIDIKLQSQSIDKTVLEVLFSTKSGKPSVGDRFKEHVIKQTCEMAIRTSLYPRTAIAVTIQELEDYGGFMACCVNCACVALLNSGVEMRDTFAAVTCAVDDSGNIVVDPSRACADAASAVMTFVFDGRSKSLITEFTEGCMSEVAYSEALERCRSASDALFTFYRDIVGKYARIISGQ